MSEHITVPRECPFCGSTNLESGGDDKFVGFRCLQCEATGPNHYGKYDWNTRAALAAPVPEGELAECHAALARVWKALGIENYAQCGGRDIAEHVADWVQAAGVEAGLRREFLARAEKAEAALTAPVPPASSTVPRDALERARPAYENLLRNQTQCDGDGVMVQVSRQALDAVLTVYGAALAAPVPPASRVHTLQDVVRAGFSLSRAEQYSAAWQIAENIGYALAAPTEIERLRAALRAIADGDVEPRGNHIALMQLARVALGED